MNIDHNKLKYISGPVVAVLVEGKINNIKKRILLFGDIHYQSQQNECTDPDSVPIKNYLHDLFKKTDKDIDFFLEDIKSTQYKEKYIHGTQYLFQLRNYFNDNQNKFKNIRFHFSDIRNEYIEEIENNFIFNEHTFNNIISERNISSNDIMLFNEKISYCQEILDIMLSLLKNNKVDINSMRGINNNFKKDFIKNIYKIVNEYNNSITQSKIRSIIKLSTFSLVEDLNKMKKMLSTAENRIKKNKFYSYYELDKFVYTFGTIYSKLRFKLILFFALLTDIYTARRILDKEYINNVITYTGAKHTMNMTNIFVNYFNFKVISKFDLNYKIPIDKLYFQKYYTKYNDDPNNNSENKLIEQCINISKFKKPIF